MTTTPVDTSVDMSVGQATAADPAGEDQRPVAVARAITGLLRSLPLPEDTDPGVRAQWFARKVALLDAIASAAAYPSLAVEARCLAREARDTARTYLRTALAADPIAVITDPVSEAQS